MDRKLQQRLVGIAVLASFLLLIAPVLLDADGRIPEKITNIPPQPKKPDFSHFQISEVESVASSVAVNEVQVVESEVDLTIAAQPKVEVVPTPTSQNSLWSVQVASFKDSAKASALRDKLRAAEQAVYVREKVLTDGTLFTQVFAGPVQTKSEAEQLKTKIKSQFKEQGLVVRFREQ